MSSDLGFMQGALSLARRGLGNVWPNPAVGCVLVKDGAVVGRGWTQPGGRPHAETEALRRAGNAAKGATAYVTLEPCSHVGETGPCADAMIQAGITRAVVAISDPDPRVSGQGLQRMRDAGIAVEVGLCSEEATRLNRGYLNRMEIGRPMVTLKLAMSLDGKIAAHTGNSQWITGDDARALAHSLRASHDAVAVGIGTARADNPHLTVRLPGLPLRPPVRIVFDSRLQLSMTSHLVATAKMIPTWVVTLEQTVEAMSERADAFEDVGVALLPVPADAHGRVSITAALAEMAQLGLTRLLVEGGSAMAAAFLSERLVDELVVARSASVIGGDGIPGIAPMGLERVNDAPRFRLLHSRLAGADVVEVFSA